jgi:uncharacterized protein (DUF2336 family)
MIEAAHLPNLHSLVELGNRDGVDIRPTLLRVMTDLYIQKPQHSEQQERQFTELALQLIDLVDHQTRAIVADKIASYPTAPAAVRQRLLKELISFKAPESGQGETAPAPAEELSELFFASSAEERRLILLNLPYALLPAAAPIAPAMAREATHRLEAAAMGHNSELFARELERILGIARSQARRVYEDQLGEPVVVAAVALGMPPTMLQRILLCLCPSISQSVQRVYELALLQEEIEPDAALRLVAIWQASHPPEQKSSPVYQPQYSHPPQRERSAPASPTARPKVAWDDFIRSAKADSA